MNFVNIVIFLQMSLTRDQQIAYMQSLKKMYLSHLDYLENMFDLTSDAIGIMKQEYLECTPLNVPEHWARTFDEKCKYAKEELERLTREMRKLRDLFGDGDSQTVEL